MDSGRWKKGIRLGCALAAFALAGCQAALTPPETARETVELTLLTPDAGWEFRIREVRETEDEVWVWAEVERAKGPAAQQLSTVRTEVDLPMGKRRRVFVTGKTWNWQNEESYEFLSRAPSWPAHARPVAPSEREDSAPPPAPPRASPRPERAP